MTPAGIARNASALMRLASASGIKRISSLYGIAGRKSKGHAVPDKEGEAQRTPGRRQPCCISLAWALKTRYIKRGYMWSSKDGPSWIPWTLNLSGTGWIETSPIHFCCFCGANLDEKEE